MPQVERSALRLDAAQLTELQALLRSHVPQATVWAYGSRVTGSAQECSDLDLVLRHPVDPAREITGWYELKEALVESRLPMLVDIHLWSRLPTSFHPEIERAYVVLQQGDEDKKQF